MSLQSMKDNGDAPQWLDEEGYKVLRSGYLLLEETPRQAYERVAKASARHLSKDNSGYDYETLWRKFYEIIDNNWLGCATPVMANMGTERGLPISCFNSYVPDNLGGIMDTVKEIAMMSKYGGGTSGYLGDVRPSGASIAGTGGISNGAIAWAKILDSTITSVSQGGVRRGALALYMQAEHGDIHEFLRMRKPEGDPNRQCLNLHHGVNLSDDFMNKVLDGEKSSRKIWLDILKTRSETGEPYLYFTDTVRRADPEWYKAAGWSTKGSNLCNEIYLASDKDHSFVCCLSSMNLARYDEWKNTDAVYYATMFLDGVMSEFIEKAKKLEGLERAVRFAEKSRALGLGVLGWHTLLQEKQIPFDSFEAMRLNAEIFRHINDNTIRASKDMAKVLGEPELMNGFGRRNSHLVAVAPTVSNSTISGNVSPGIEPIAANAFVKNSTQGSFINFNRSLKKLLAEIGEDNEETWKSIIKNSGSVQHLKSLTDAQREVFLTAREINQYAIIKQASQRQKWIDQGQSVNVFFASNSDPKYINKVHIAAWQEGLKGMYYLRSSSPLRADMTSRDESECKACEA